MAGKMDGGPCYYWWYKSNFQEWAGHPRSFNYLEYEAHLEGWKYDNRGGDGFERSPFDIGKHLVWIVHFLAGGLSKKMGRVHQWFLLVKTWDPTSGPLYFRNRLGNPNLHSMQVHPVEPLQTPSKLVNPFNIDVTSDPFGNFTVK